MWEGKRQSTDFHYSALYASGTMLPSLLAHSGMIAQGGVVWGKTKMFQSCVSGFHLWK